MFKSTCQNAKIKVFDSSLTTNIHKHVLCGLPCLLGTSILSHMVCPKFSPFLLYRWAKVETLHYHIKIFILKNFQSFNFFSFFPMGQLKWFIKNTKSYMSNEIFGKDFPQLLLLCLHPWFFNCEIINFSKNDYIFEIPMTCLTYDKN
jgi:hypothetical protein